LEVSEQDVTTVFAQFGKIKAVRPHTQNGRYFGAIFLEYHNMSSARLARRQMNGRHWGTNTVFVNAAKGRRKDATRDVPLGRSETSDVAPNRSIYVAGLPYSWKADDVSQLFGRFGEYADIRPVHKGGKPTGVAFVDFVLLESAGAAVDELDGTELEGRRLNVNYALPQEKGKGKDAKAKDKGVKRKRDDD